jgi:hypothetical protein
MNNEIPFGGKIIRGNADALDGQVVAYASFTENEQKRFIAVQGDYRKHSNLKDFLNSEFKNNDSASLDELLKNPELLDLEDPKKKAMLDKLKDVPDMEVVPVPAKLIPFAKEEQILAMEGDLIWLGNFTKGSNAQMVVSVFPLMYQAIYRDQEADLLNREIDDLISEPLTPIESTIPTYLNFKGDLNQHLLMEYIPSLVDAFEKVDFDDKWQEFIDFMADYRPEKDIESIKILLPNLSQVKSRKHLELICQKITAIKDEQFDMVEMIDDLIEHVYGE